MFLNPHVWSQLNKVVVTLLITSHAMAGIHHVLGRYSCCHEQGFTSSSIATHVTVRLAVGPEPSAGPLSGKYGENRTAPSTRSGSPPSICSCR